MAEASAHELEAIKKAFHTDDAAAVARILEKHPDLKLRINEPIGPFDSPAIANVRSREMLDVLLAAGADINGRSNWWAGGFGLLDSADEPLARYAIERGARLDAHAAARLGMLDALTKLIDETPHLVRSRGGDGQTPLHFAANIEIAEFLLDRGADIDALDVDHESTPAQYMVRSRQEVAQYLVSRGAKTDILMAAAFGDADLVRTLLDRDPGSIRTRVSSEYFPMVGPKTGGTIYQWALGWYVYAHLVARDFGHEAVFDLLMALSPDDLKLIAYCWLRDEVNVDALIAGGSGRTPSAERRAPADDVAHAARNNDLEAVRLMLKAGLPVTARSQHGATALHWAGWHGNAEMAKLLVEHGAPLEDRENDYQGTPLSWAIHGSEHGWNPAGGDYGATVRVLLEAGAKRPDGPAGSQAVREVLSRASD